jgi:hypothetical protein
MIHQKLYNGYFSLILSFTSLVLSYGLNLTLGRVLYTSFFINYEVAEIFAVLSAVSLAVYNRYYVFIIPLAFLGYLIPVKYISIIVFLISLTAISRLPKIARELILFIDAMGISYITLYLFSVKINVLVIPLALLQNGPMITLPIFFIFGIIYGLKREKVNIFKYPTLLSFMLPLIYLIPLTSLNIFKYPETVDWIFYFNWLQHPTVGWFFYSRPLYLLILFIFGIFINHLTLARLEFPPLAFLYVFSAYYLGNTINKGLGPISAFMAGISPMLLTFLYSGLDANLFSISIMFIAISFLIKRKTFPAILLSYVALFSHVYAWAQLEGSILIYVLIIYLLKRSIPSHLIKYTIFTAPPFILGIILVLTGFFSVPIGDSYSNFYFQTAFLSWGSASAFIYYVISIYGLRGTPRIIYIMIFSSIFASFFLEVVQNLIIDTPLFLPAAIGLSKMRRDLVFPFLLFFLLWGIYMILNSFPYLFQGVTI